MTTLYEWYKTKYEETKPIRGRAEDIRPIGQRRRDWERVVKEERTDGVWYGAKLYQTEVVMYSPDGRMELRVNDWATPSTADFMTAHSPFRANKTRGNIWVRLGEQNVPVAKSGVTKFRIDNGKWVLDQELKLKQKVVDRSKSKQVRERIRGFINYANTMLKLSDGWVRAATTAQWRTLDEGDASWRYKRYEYDFGFEMGVKSILEGRKLSRWERERRGASYNQFQKDVENTLELLSVEDTEIWERAMYCILNKSDHMETETVESIKYKPHPESDYETTLTLLDIRYSKDRINRFVTNMIKNMDDMHTEREVDGTCIRSNLVI